MTLLHTAPDVLYDALEGTTDAKKRYRAYNRLLRQYKQRQVATPAQPDPMRKRIQNASDACGTGALYFVWFRVERAIRRQSRQLLHRPTDLDDITAFIAYIRGEPSIAYKPFKAELSAGSQWAYVANATKALRVFTNVDWNDVPSLQDTRTDINREVNARRSSKFPLSVSQVRRMAARARNPDEALIRGLQRTYADAKATLHTWACSMLLQYLGILRYGESGHSTSTRAEPARLLSWGVGLKFFRLKPEWRWTREPKHIGDHRDVTEDISLNDLKNTPVDGIELVWRAGTATKGNQAARHTRTMAIWDPRNGQELPKLAQWLKDEFARTKPHQAGHGKPVFMVETTRLGWVPLDNAKFNAICKRVAEGIIGNAAGVSSRQLRSGGKTNASWAEFAARRRGDLGATSALGRWAPGSRVGNSDRYEQRPRELYYGVAEQMLVESTNASPAAWSTMERLKFQAEITARDALRGRCSSQ